MDGGKGEVCVLLTVVMVEVVVDVCTGLIGQKHSKGREPRDRVLSAAVIGCLGVCWWDSCKAIIPPEAS